MNTSTRLLAAVLIASAVGFGLGFGLAPGPKPVEAEESVLVPRVEAHGGSASSTSSRPGLSLAPGTDGGRDVATAEVTTPEVSPTRLAAAKASIDTPSIERVTGDGAITGQVVDVDGAPMSGVVVLAYDSTQLPRGTSSRVGGPPPEEKSLDETLEDSAASWASSRSKRRRTTTASDGSFAFRDLADQPFTLRAYREGFTFTTAGPRTVRPGATVDLRGRAVHGFPLDLRLPDGSQPEHAVLVVQAGNDSARYSWSPDDPVLTYTKPTIEVTAYAELLPGSRSGWREGPASVFHSKPLLLDASGIESPVQLLELTPRTGLRGRVTREQPMKRAPEVCAVLVEGTSDFDPSKVPDGAKRVDASTGDYRILDLAVGTYAVGVIPPGTDAIAGHVFVEVTEGIVEVDLHEPAPDAADHLVVTCLDEHGRLLDDVDFEHSYRSDRGSSSGHVSASLAPDGTWWIPLHQFSRHSGGTWDADATVELTASSDLFGPQRHTLSQGQRTLTVHFKRPVRLTVQVAGYADRGNQDFVVWVLPQDAQGGHVQPIAQSKHPRGWGDGPRISAEGTVTFTTIPAGSWKVELHTAEQWFGMSTALDSLVVDVGTSDAAATLRIPTLHELVVLAPSLQEGEWLWMRREGDGNRNSVNGQVDADGRCVFEGLLTGTYRIQGNGHSMTVEVPGPEVLFEAPRTIAYRVAIVDESGTMYQAGLRHGDDIIGWGDGYLDDGLDPNTFRTIAEGLDLYVLRDGRELTLDGVKLEGGYWNPQTTGGSVVPIQEGGSQ